MQQADLKRTHVDFETSQGQPVEATLERFRRASAVFQVFSPQPVLRLSELLSNFQIRVQDVQVYSGRAVLTSLLDTGSSYLAEASLEESGWKELIHATPEQLSNALAETLKLAERDYELEPEYKLVVADMQSLLTRLRLWSDQVEMAWAPLKPGERLLREQEFQLAVERVIIPRVDAYFERFEAAAKSLPPERAPAHREFMRRLLHPLVLSAPFPHRAYFKPLGYAGDYEMVGMMARNQPGGATSFARAVDAWFLRQPPAEAHRNRLQVLVNHLHSEAVRAAARGRKLRVFNVACGPAEELRQFIEKHQISSEAEFTLLDFNAETLAYAQKSLETAAQARSRACRVETIRKSVHTLIKESMRGQRSAYTGQYDFVYCAGLFDYLSDEVCRRLINSMYDWLVPGGFLLATNVEPHNPLRYGMEHLLDWHLVYRNGADMLRLSPADPDSESCSTIEQTGFNVFLETRRPGP